MKHVWVLQHEWTSTDERDFIKRDFIKMIGVYSSELNAKRAVERLPSAPGFKDTPEGFAIDKYELDQDHWVEGFVTILHG